MQAFNRRGALPFALAGVIVAAMATSTFAQTYPAKPIRVVAPFPPGNAADVVSRAMSDKLSQRLGQSVVVDNRAGGGGIIGVDAAAKAAPDGYTLLITSLSPVTLLPAVYKKLPYDPLKDFAPIAMIGFTSMMLVVHPSVPANNLAELVTLLKSNPGKHNYAHIGAGTISHLTMESLRAATGVDVVGIPYKGSAQVFTDMLGGQVTLMFDGMTSSNVQVKAGKLKAIAVTSAKRSPFAPSIPTLGEGGYPALHDLNMIAWIGLFAPVGTPRAIIERWHKEMLEVTELPDVKERLAAVSVEPAVSESPEKFGEFHRNEVAKWSRIAQGAGVYQSQ